MLVLRTLILAGIGLLSTCKAIAQVEIDVPASLLSSEDVIHVKVTNKGRLPMSYCVEFGQRSPHAGTIETTPIPFYVEKLNGEKWSVLMIGPDTGNSRHGVGLEPGSSQDFPFRLRDQGTMRLVLHYWMGNREDVCSETVKRWKTLKSRPFSIIGH